MHVTSLIWLSQGQGYTSLKRFKKQQTHVFSSTTNIKVKCDIISVIDNINISFIKLSRKSAKNSAVCHCAIFSNALVVAYIYNTSHFLRDYEGTNYYIYWKLVQNILYLTKYPHRYIIWPPIKVSNTKVFSSRPQKLLPPLLNTPLIHFCTIYIVRYGGKLWGQI